MVSVGSGISNHVADGVTLLFSAANINISSLDEVHVYHTPTGGAEVERTYNEAPTTDLEFKITSITDTGFNVEFGLAPAAGRISIRRELAVTQETHFRAGRGFPATAFETALDKLTMLVQELNEVAVRGLTLPLSEDAGNTALPALAPNKFLGLDANSELEWKNGTVDIGAGDVTTDVLADDAVTDAKIAQWEGLTRGQASITLSNYDNDLEPVVKAGSSFDNNGVLIEVSTDQTPAGYTLRTAGAVAYIYWSVANTVFEYQNTVPTWSDDLQGWYNGVDRALFSIYKDSGATLYQDKNFLKSPTEKQLNTGIKLNGDIDLSHHLADVDRLIKFASDASLLWDESADQYVVNKNVSLGANTLASGEITSTGALNGTAINTGLGDFEVGQDLRMTDTPKFTGLEFYNGSTNVDRNIGFASDADILWDESADEFVINKGVNSSGVLKGTSIDTGYGAFDVFSPDYIGHISQSYNGPGTIVLVTLATGRTGIILCEQYCYANTNIVSIQLPATGTFAYTLLRSLTTNPTTTSLVFGGGSASIAGGSNISTVNPITTDRIVYNLVIYRRTS